MKRNSPDRILTLHPAGKNGVRIERAKYDAMRRALLRSIPARGPGVLFKELPGLVEPLLPEAVFGPDASVMWYVTAVKQDLEARGEIEQVAGARPQRLLRKVSARATAPAAGRRARKASHA